MLHSTPPLQLVAQLYSSPCTFSGLHHLSPHVVDQPLPPSPTGKGGHRQAENMREPERDAKPRTGRLRLAVLSFRAPPPPPV